MLVIIIWPVDFFRPILLQRVGTPGIAVGHPLIASSIPGQLAGEAKARLAADLLEEDRQEEINWPDDDDQQQLEFPKG